MNLQGNNALIASMGRQHGLGASMQTAAKSRALDLQKKDFETRQHESASVGANKCFGPSTVEVCLLNTGYVLQRTSNVCYVCWGSN